MTNDTKRLLIGLGQLTGAVLYGYVAGAMHTGTWYSFAVGIPLGYAFLSLDSWKRRLA